MKIVDVLMIRAYEEDDISIVVAEGDVDLSTAGTLRQALEQTCSAIQSQRTVAVDIRDVPFIDSAGLALLVEVRKRYAEHCRIALLISTGSQPERVLRLGRFDTFLKIAYQTDELKDMHLSA